jgi:pimeloyl-[acyl-carrier protein] synthase
MTEGERRVAGARRDTKRRLSLYQLLDPAVLADPYPLYERLRREAPVHWDPFLHAWIVTRHDDVVHVLSNFSATCTPSPEQLAGLGMESLAPVAEILVRQMLFLDAPAHTRVRRLAARAFTPRRVELLRGHITDIVERLLDAVQDRGSMDVIADLARPLPAIVSAEMLGLPPEDWLQLTAWSCAFAEILGNFQHDPDSAARVLRSAEEMTAYLRQAIREQADNPRDGLLRALMHAEVDGDRFSEEEVIANTIITMVGGQETTTNLIGNGILSLLRRPDQWERLKAEPSLMPSAVEELLRFESPSQHTARLAPEDTELGGNLIHKRDGVIAVLGAANRDPEQFADPDRLDLGREDNRHVAFGWAAHFCFGASLARIEGQQAFASLARRMGDMRLTSAPLTWRPNLGLRGLNALPVEF